jgi:hypothetical protein
MVIRSCCLFLWLPHHGRDRFIPPFTTVLIQHRSLSPFKQLSARYDRSFTRLKCCSRSLITTLNLYSKLSRKLPTSETSAIPGTKTSVASKVVEEWSLPSGCQCLWLIDPQCAVNHNGLCERNSGIYCFSDQKKITNIQWSAEAVVQQEHLRKLK